MPKGKTKFDRCVRAVARSGSAADPRAVCGAMRAKGTLPKGKRHNPAGKEVELGGGRHFLPMLSKGHAEQMARLLRLEGANASATQLRGTWGVMHEHAGKSNPSYRKVKKAARAAQRRGELEPGPMFQKFRKAARKSKTGRRKANRGRRNPLDGALATYEGFHGRPSEEIVEVTTEVHEHSHLAGLGDLVKLVIVTDSGAKVIIQKFEDDRGNPAILCQNERPKHGEYKPQLFIEGGDQSVRLSDFGIFEPYHEVEVLGRCRNVYYYTRKDHLGSDGGTATYNHKFGGMREVKGRGGKVRRKRSPLPTVLYDTRNRLLSFAGGGYTIPDEGIDN